MMPARLALCVAGALGLGSLSACRYAPMGYFHTYGPAADPIATLGWGLTIICSVVVVVIAVLVLMATLRARVPAGDMAAIQIARTPGGLPWIYVGTGVSTVVLLVLVIWTLFTLAAVASPPQAAAFTIEIHAHQWWWEARYIDGKASRTFSTANELHIPVGVPVQLRLISDDVIHSFWIPALAGKTDVVPGQTNTAWLEATQAGTYRGQCTEYCGAQHAHMAEFAIAESAPDFEQWWTAQLADAAAPDVKPERGKTVFLEHCAACHAIRGIGAGGILGPDLTHLMSRRTIAAGALPNDAASLQHWIADAQSIKPGALMPTLSLSSDDLQAVTHYVQTLQ